MKRDSQLSKACGCLAGLALGDAMRAVRYAANVGGDTDTIGAIAGALAGIDAIDRTLLAAVERVNKLDLAAVAQGLLRVGASGEVET